MDFTLSSSPKHLVAMNRASTQGEAQFGILSKAPLKLSVLQLSNSSKLGHPGGCSEWPSLSINSESQAWPCLSHCSYLSVVAMALPKFLVEAAFPAANSARLRVAVVAVAAAVASVLVSLCGCLPLGWGGGILKRSKKAERERERWEMRRRKRGQAEATKVHGRVSPQLLT